LPPGVDDRRVSTAFALSGFGPSLVRDQVEIRYCVDKRANVRLAVYDAVGSLVRTLASGPVSPGERAVTWNRTDNSGRRVAGGAYFYRLEVDGRWVSSKAIVLE
jgi:hypothetical protein